MKQSELSETLVLGNYEPVSPQDETATALEAIPHDRYEILHLAHSRALLVAHAFDRHREMRVFIKAVDPRLQEPVHRLVREANVLESLNHPQIPRLIDLRATDRYAYIATEPMPGVSGVVQRLSETQDVRAAATLCLSALRPMQYIHERGIIHRDIKTSNFVMREDGVVSLIDFELAQRKEHTSKRARDNADHRNSDDITKTGSAPGSPAYMPVEQFMGLRLSPQSDIYNLGSTLHELLTGSVPFPPSDDDTEIMPHQLYIRKLEPKADDYWQNGEHVPSSLRWITEKALQSEAIDRFGSAEEMAEALERFLLDG